MLLYNQLLDRYNTIDEQRRQQPVRVSMVNPPGEAPTVLPPTTVDPSPAVSSLLESEIVESAPKTMKKRVRHLLEKLKACVEPSGTNAGSLFTTENPYVAALHEAPDVTVRRSIARVHAVVQQNVSSHHWNGSDECRRIEPGDCVAADIRRRRRSEQAETASGRSRAYKQGKETIQERLHGEQE